MEPSSFASQPFLARIADMIDRAASMMPMTTHLRGFAGMVLR
jgi:hypothetical protein